MKTVKYICYLLITILFALGCKKEHVPVSTTGTPEFYFNGTIGGTSASFSAGLNNYYMYSSYLQDTNKVYNFIGDLKQTASGQSSIQILINDYKVSALNGSTNIDSSLVIGNYLYYLPGTVITSTTTKYDVQFNSSYTNGTAQIYNWSFGDGTTSTLSNPMHSYASLNYYNVCLSVTGSNSCTNSICNDSLNLSSSAALTCQTAITSTVYPGSNRVDFTAIPSSGFHPSTYLWNFGGTTSNDSAGIANMTYIYGDSGLYHVSLKASDTLGNVSITKYNVATATFPSSCITNFSVTSVQAVTTTVTTTNSSLGLGAVTIIWTDASGNIYTSKNSAQPTSSNFQIISVDNYQNNANNQHTKKLHVKFNCMVYSSGHPPLQITNADAVIAVAYK